MTMRLDKFLTSQGIGSRTEVKELLRKRRVMVDGQSVADPAADVKPEKNIVVLDGKQITYRESLHMMLNKPAGVLTAAEDRKQPTVMDCLPPIARTLACMPVGRLDKDTEGLLFMTTDGQLAHRLISPRWGIEKRYRAKLDAPLSGEDIEAFAKGLVLSDFQALPAKLEIGEEPDIGLVTVQEGKFHQVKRMFAACGKHVLDLKRLSFGGIELDPSLMPGEARELTKEETAYLYEICGMGRQ